LRPLRYTRRFAVVAGVLAVAFGLSAWEKARPELIAVANADVAHVHYGTNESETVRFDLNEGDRVTVDKRANGWSRVTTENGERGWAQDADLVFVGPPYEPPAKVNASTTAPPASANPGVAERK
jgi:phage tail protein X